MTRAHPDIILHMDIDDLEYIWMTGVISAWRRDKKLGIAMHYVALVGAIDKPWETIKQFRSGHNAWAFIRARVWLAFWYRPVSDALFDGKSEEQAIKIWKKTKPTATYAARAQRDLRDRKRAQAEADLAQTRYDLEREQFHNANKSPRNWNICKPTRSR